MAKPIVAVDIDEVLAPHNATLAELHNRLFGTSHTVNEYHEDWPALWGVDYEEGERRAAIWHASDEMKTMAPLPGSLHGLGELAKRFDLVIVTGRSKFMAEMTEQWLEQHYPKLFKQVEFVGLYAEGAGTTKADTCQRLGVSYLIDDSLTQVTACAEVGISTVLFGDYNWNQADTLPKQVTRCKDWPAVLEYFDGRS